MVELLVSRGAAVEARDRQGISPLMYAVMHAHVEVRILSFIIKTSEIPANNDGLKNQPSPTLHRSLFGPPGFAFRPQYNIL